MLRNDLILYILFLVEHQIMIVFYFPVEEVDWLSYKNRTGLYNE